jgi:uncharacterized protein YacL
MIACGIAIEYFGEDHQKFMMTIVFGTLGVIFAFKLFNHYGLFWQFDMTSNEETDVFSVSSALIFFTISILIGGACAWTVDYFMIMGPAIVGSSIFGAVGFVVLFTLNTIYRQVENQNLFTPFWNAAILFIVGEIGAVYGFYHT